MKLLKSLLLVAVGIGAAKLFPEQVDYLIDQAKMIDADSVKSGIASVKDFFISIIDIFRDAPAEAAA